MSVESLDLSVDKEGAPTEQLLCRLEEGQYFGEISLLDETDKTTRPTSIIAAKDLHLIEINRKAWTKVLRMNANRIEDEKRLFINSIYLLANFFTRNARKRMIDGFKIQKRCRLQYLFQ